MKTIFKKSFKVKAPLKLCKNCYIIYFKTQIKMIIYYYNLKQSLEVVHYIYTRNTNRYKAWPYLCTFFSLNTLPQIFFRYIRYVENR